MCGVTHLVWGLGSTFAPALVYNWIHATADNSAITLWHFLGMLQVVAGVACIVASRSPFSQSLVLATMIGAECSLSIVSFAGVLRGEQPTTWLWFGLIWGIVWATPLAMILWALVRAIHAKGSAFLDPEADDPRRELKTNAGSSLDELADQRPQMIVFLRHAGCTFCRQSLADIHSVRQQIQATGCGIIFVHLGREDDPKTVEVFTKYGVEDLPRISDPTSRLYRQFGLDLGGFTELFGLRVWLRGLLFGLVNGHGIGAVRGNSFQMPGVYLYHCGVILGGFRHERASDRPNYLRLAQEVSSQTVQSTTVADASLTQHFSCSK